MVKQFLPGVTVECQECCERRPSQVLEFVLETGRES